MKIRKEIVYFYGCKVCGEEYKDDKKTARRCEKLAVEKQMFKKGDRVEVIAGYSNAGIAGIISAVKLYSPVDDDDMTVRFGISRKSHFYLYEVNFGNGKFADFLTKQLKKV